MVNNPLIKKKNPVIEFSICIKKKKLIQASGVNIEETRYRFSVLLDDFLWLPFLMRLKHLIELIFVVRFQFTFSQ